MRIRVLSTVVFLCIGLLTPSVHVSHAEELTAVARVLIQEPQIASTGDTHTLSFFAQNEGSSALRAVFGVRIQDALGKNIYTDTGSVETLSVGVQKQAIIDFALPERSGTYTVFAIVSSENGVPMATLKAKELSVGGGSYTVAHVSPCTYIDTRVSCEAHDTITRATYSVLRGSASGSIVYEGEATRGTASDAAGAFSFDIGNEALVSGRYTLVLSFFDDSESLVDTQELFFEYAQGSWLSIDIVSIEDSAHAFDARAFLSGNHTPGEEWGLWFWVLDRSGMVCAHDKQRFGDTLPREYLVHETISSCEGAHLVVVGHLGKDTYGAYRIADTYGEGDISALMRGSTDEDTTLADAHALAPIVVGIALILLVLFIIVVFILRKPRATLVLLFVLGMGVASTASADTFISGNDVFTVTLEKTTYQSNETVDFTFTLQDSTTGAKPLGDSVQVRVDSGSYTQIVSVSDTATTYNISLPAVTTGGAHTLNFNVPGHFFGSALFGSYRFGIGNRTFSVPFSISVNTAPAQPTITGSCIVGTTNTFYFRSTDAQGDTLFYEDLFNSEITPERLPGVGYVASGTQLSTTRTRATPGSESIQARATDSLGSVSTWNTQVIPCVVPCSHCVYNGGAPSSIFTVSSPLVYPGDQVILSWDLENVTNCAITSNHADGDSWTWDTVRTVASAQTSPITETTTYTMTCDRVDGSALDPITARVDLVPLFEEF